MPICFANNAVLLKDVKAWLISNADHWKDKTVIGLKQRCFYPGGAKNLPQTNLSILKLLNVSLWWSRDSCGHRSAQDEF